MSDFPPEEYLKMARFAAHVGGLLDFVARHAIRQATTRIRKGFKVEVFTARGRFVGRSRTREGAFRSAAWKAEIAHAGRPRRTKEER